MSSSIENINKLINSKLIGGYESNIDWILTDDLMDCCKCKHFQKKISEEPCMNCIHNNKFERNK